MPQRREIKIRKGMYFMTDQTFCVFEPKAGRLVSAIFFLFRVVRVDGKQDKDRGIGYVVRVHSFDIFSS